MVLRDLFSAIVACLRRISRFNLENGNTTAFACPSGNLKFDFSSDKADF